MDFIMKKNQSQHETHLLSSLYLICSFETRKVRVFLHKLEGKAKNKIKSDMEVIGTIIAVNISYTYNV